VQVTIGGTPYPVLWSGLSPYMVGIYQINLYVPGDRAQGDSLPVIVTAGGNSSATDTAPVTAVHLLSPASFPLRLGSLAWTAGSAIPGFVEFSRSVWRPGASGDDRCRSAHGFRFVCSGSRCRCLENHGRWSIMDGNFRCDLVIAGLLSCH